MRIGFASIVLALSVLAHGAEGDATQAAFEIAHDGRLERLVGNHDFEAPSALAFDSRNRPYMFNTCEPQSYGDILTLRRGLWKRLSYLQVLRNAIPDMEYPRLKFIHALGTITIDDSDALYAIIPVWKNTSIAQRTSPWDNKPSSYVLLYSPDLGDTFQVYTLPEGKAFLEIRVGHNELSKPPVIGVVSFREEYPAKWANYHDLSVLVPQKTDDSLVLGEPIHITSDCFGVSNHSGGYTFAITTGQKTHIAYAEIPKQPHTGNPTFVATVDRQDRKLVSREFVATALPQVSDVHATPVIAADTKGYLHLVCGAHNQPFLYSRSLRPDDVEAGWTKPREMFPGQTYATLIIDSKAQLHLVYRNHLRLLYVTKSAASEKWSQPMELVSGPKGYSGYGVFYHRLFIDRAGSQYLSFTFYPLETKIQGCNPRALVMSEDGGKTWRLTTTDSFEQGILGK